MTSLWAWIKKALGFDIVERVSLLEKRMIHNESAISGAIEAFKQFAKDAER